MENSCNCRDPPQQISRRTFALPSPVDNHRLSSWLTATPPLRQQTSQGRFEACHDRVPGDVLALANDMGSRDPDIADRRPSCREDPAVENIVALPAIERRVLGIENKEVRQVAGR